MSLLIRVGACVNTCVCVRVCVLVAVCVCVCGACVCVCVSLFVHVLTDCISSLSVILGCLSETSAARRVLGVKTID